MKPKPFIPYSLDPRTDNLSVYDRKKPVTNMAKYECMVCGWVYDEDVGDPDSGIAAGTKFADLPDDWVCPMCGASKQDFEQI
jgi:rubredoxin